jgi:CRISPR-associated endonuclease/helicase Cas3
MSSLDFPAAFEALTRYKPLLWQKRLFARLAAGDLPDACDIPTGLGKTSVMAIWLAALDLRPGAMHLPRRLIYVVDRRAVVDQATEEAERLADALGEGTDAGGTIAALRDRLTLEFGRRLPVSTLRGQYADNRTWLDDPSTAVIVVGTVDMIGSRLLFQGYNVSRGMRPVHAALIGNDALIVLDEAHLVPPFEALVGQVKSFADADRECAPFGVPEMRLMTLSATGRGKGKNLFGLESEDESEDDIVRQRLHAGKRLKLEPSVATGDLARTMAERAWQHGDGGRRVVVFCNSRKIAQAVYEDLSDRLKNFGKKTSELSEFVALMVGARRVREREELARTGAFRRFSPKTAEEEKAKADGMPAFLIATSAGEVGVDIDADHMVCDLVAWERMVQRLGRVNRLGELVEGSLADVFPALFGKDKEWKSRSKIVRSRNGVRRLKVNSGAQTRTDAAMQAPEVCGSSGRTGRSRNSPTPQRRPPRCARH